MFLLNLIGIKKRSYNIFRHFELKGIIDNSYESLSPITKLAYFVNNKRGGYNNEDFTQGWTMDTNLKMNKKIIGNDILQTDLFSGKEKDLNPSA